MRTPVLLAAFLASLAACAAGASAQGERRVALVIGNSAYKEQPLRNAANDARTMGDALKGLGFAVTVRTDAGKTQMEDAILGFGRELAKGGVGLFFYAGHGIQAKGRNYLIPVDAQIDHEDALGFRAIDVDQVLIRMRDAGNRLNMVMLDACRNNPFERRMRGASQGLAAVDAARGTLIAYATAPGSVAADGEGRNGVFTEELAKALAVPNLKVEDVFKLVTAGVEDRTKGAQTPWVSSSLRGDFVFNVSLKAAPSSAAPDRESVFWQSIQYSDRAEDFQEYLRLYPNGTFAGLAKSRAAALAKPAPPPAAAPGDQPKRDLKAGLSRDGRAIVDALEKESGGDLTGLCRADANAIHQRIVAVSTRMTMRGEVSGNPMAAGEEAGRWFGSNCFMIAPPK
jgi:hypothetical protein